MRNEVKNRMKKLMKKAEGAIENVKDLLNGREQGGIIVTLVVVGFLVVSVVTIVVVTFQAAGEASRSSSSAWRVVDNQSEPVDPKVYTDAQNATGKSQMKQAGKILEGGIAADTLASPGSSEMRPSCGRLMTFSAVGISTEPVALPSLGRLTNRRSPCRLGPTRQESPLAEEHTNSI